MGWVGGGEVTKEGGEGISNKGVDGGGSGEGGGFEGSGRLGSENGTGKGLKYAILNKGTTAPNLYR